MGSVTKNEDKFMIQELMARYNFALNFGDEKAWVDCFTQDGVFECPFGTHKGSSALYQYISERTEERQEHPIRHMLSNIIIDVQDDRASAKSYLLMMQVLPEGMKLLTTGTYADDLVKMEGAWRFSHRKVQLDSMEWGNQVFSVSYLEKR